MSLRDSKKTVLKFLVPFFWFLSLPSIHNFQRISLSTFNTPHAREVSPARFCHFGLAESTVQIF